MTTQSKTFWTTLPGILTGVAALITAIGGIYLILQNKPKDPNSTGNREAPKKELDNESCGPTYGLEGYPVVAGTGEIFLFSGSPSAQGAKVYLNGKCQERMLKREEKALLLLTQIPPGDYFIKISKTGFQDYSRNILVKGGERSSITFDLRE